MNCWYFFCICGIILIFDVGLTIKFILVCLRLIFGIR